MKQEQEEKKDYDFETTLSTEFDDITGSIFRLIKIKPTLIDGKKKVVFNVKGIIIFDLNKQSDAECKIKLNTV